jgi:carboxyl-terminal processing protease
LVSVFEQMNDFHSQITYNNRQFSNYPMFDDSTLKYLQPLVMLSQTQNGIIKTKLLLNEFVYIQVPGIQALGDQINEYAKALSDSICIYKDRNIKGFIVDLRLNSGGQLSSMIAGLNSLLGNSCLGGGVDFSNTETKRFELKDGNFYINGSPMTCVQNYCVSQFDEFPVAILIGPATRSSGSITAIAFKTRPKTVFIGEPTADGYSTGNDYFYFGYNLSMNLSTEFSQDRKGTVYKNSVNPDIYIKGGYDFDNLLNDKTILSAFEWISDN